MKKHTALIIEDDPKLNKVMTITFQTEFEVETCSDGSTGLNRLKETDSHPVVFKPAWSAWP